MTGVGVVLFVGAAALGGAAGFWLERHSVRRLLERMRGTQRELEATNRSLEAIVQARTRDVLRAERKYRSLMGQAPTGILLWDPETLEISEANVRAGELLGERPRDLVGRGAESLLSPHDRTRTLRALRRVLEVGNVHLDEVWLESRAGVTFPAEVVASIVRFDDESAVLVLIRDLSDLKEFERRTALLNQQIRRTEKMASMGQLAAGVAHEINNPMGYVSSNINRLVEYAKRLPELIRSASGSGISIGALAEVNELVGELEEIALDANEGVSRVTEIVRALREFSHGTSSATRLEWVDLNKVVRNCLTLVRNEVKHCAVELNLPELPPVRCQPLQIGQVVMNLVLNAAQAAERGGRISLSSHASGEVVHIAVEDNGRGIAVEHLPRIFEPFFTTKPVGCGTGLGLAVSHEIVRRHHGQLCVDSRVGRGTRFVIELPCDPSAVKEGEPKA